MAKMWHKCVPLSTLRVSQGCRKGVARVSGFCRKSFEIHFLECLSIKNTKILYNIPDFPTLATLLRHLPDTFPTLRFLPYSPTATTLIVKYPRFPDTFLFFSLAHLKKNFFYYRGVERP